MMNTQWAVHDRVRYSNARTALERITSRYTPRRMKGNAYGLNGSGAACACEALQICSEEAYATPLMHEAGLSRCVQLL